MFRRVPWTAASCRFRLAPASQDLSKGTRDLRGGEAAPRLPRERRLTNLFGVHLPPKPTAALLNQQPFFHGIPWTSLERLAALASYAHFAERELIFESGGHADQFYVLLRGSVALEAPSGSGGVSVVQSLESGETLGWSWLFPPYRWSFSARALVSVDALVLSGGILRTRCEEDPIMAAAMMRRVAGVMLDRLQATRRRLATLERAAAGVPIRLTVSAGPGDAVSPAT